MWNGSEKFLDWIHKKEQLHLVDIPIEIATVQDLCYCSEATQKPFFSSKYNMWSQLQYRKDAFLVTLLSCFLQGTVPSSGMYELVHYYNEETNCSCTTVSQGIKFRMFLSDNKDILKIN